MLTIKHTSDLEELFPRNSIDFKKQSNLASIFWLDIVLLYLFFKSLSCFCSCVYVESYVRHILMSRPKIPAHLHCLNRGMNDSKELS